MTEGGDVYWDEYTKITDGRWIRPLDKAKQILK